MSKREAYWNRTRLLRPEYKIYIDPGTHGIQCISNYNATQSRRGDLQRRQIK